VALDEQGNATILWQQNRGNALDLVGIHGSPTSSRSDVVPLETDNAAGSLGLVTEYAYPSVAIDGSGSVLAVWRKKPSAADAATYGAYGTRFAAGSWLPQAKLGLKTGFDVSGLSVSVADSGFGAAAFGYGGEVGVAHGAQARRGADRLFLADGAAHLIQAKIGDDPINPGIKGSVPAKFSQSLKGLSKGVGDGIFSASVDSLQHIDDHHIILLFQNSNGGLRRHILDLIGNLIGKYADAAHSSLG